jgi:cysteinyl-tRNA synthetase
VRAPAGAGKALVKEFNAALDDDLDTPRAIRALRRAVREGDFVAARWMLAILVGGASLV